MTIIHQAKSGIFRAKAIRAAALMLSAMHVRTADAREIKIATISAANSPWDHAMRKFAEETKKLSNGDLTVRVYTDAQLGNISKMQIGRASCRERCVSTCRSRWSPYH